MPECRNFHMRVYQRVMPDGDSICHSSDARPGVQCSGSSRPLENGAGRGCRRGDWNEAGWEGTKGASRRAALFGTRHATLDQRFFLCVEILDRESSRREALDRSGCRPTQGRSWKARSRGTVAVTRGGKFRWGRGFHPVFFLSLSGAHNMSAFCGCVATVEPSTAARAERAWLGASDR